MGSTGYYGTTAKQAKANELRGCTIIASSGNWSIARNTSGTLFAVYLKTNRYGDETVVKAVTMDMGPYEVPSEAFYRRYVALTDTEPGYVVSQYEAEWRTRCETKYHAKHVSQTVNVGDTFTVTRPYNYGHGVGEQSTFTLVDRKKRIARTEGGAIVRLPRGWESNLDHPEITSRRVVLAAIA